MDKQCYKCKETKPTSDFYIRRRNKSGIASWCKKCDNKARNESYKKNPQRKLNQNEWMRKNEFRYRLKYYYGITVDYYISLLTAQNNQCAICYKKCERGNLSVDHCHITNQIRGLLCRACNVGISQLKDSVENLESAKNYLLKDRTDVEIYKTIKPRLSFKKNRLVRGISG